jgi:GxxExxY protein
MDGFIVPDESCRIMGACFGVQNHMGSGFLESVYQECLEIEFRSVGFRSCRRRPWGFIPWVGR